MWLLLATFGFAIASALIPVLNVEAYIAIASGHHSAPAWAIVLAAAAGQMVGKVIWYFAGENLSRIPWFRTKFEAPKWIATRDRWRARTEGRPWYTASLVAFSGFIGIPPFAIVSVIAGYLKLNLPVFIIAGLVGRFARFYAILEIAQGAWFLL